MNRRDLEELRRRLEERQAAQVADPFALVVLAAAFFFLLFLITAFI
jgi:hypothetical protein